MVLASQTSSTWSFRLLCPARTRCGEMTFDFKDAQLGDNLINIEAGAKLLSDRAALFGSLYEQFQAIADGGQKVYKDKDQVLDDALLVAASFIKKHDTDEDNDKNLSFHAASNALAQAANLLLLIEQLTSIENQVDTVMKRQGMTRKTARL